MSLEAKRKSLADKQAQMKALREKVEADTATPEDVAALTAAVKEIDALVEQIDALVAADRAAAKDAAPVSQPARTPARPKDGDDTVQFKMGVIMAGMAYTKAGHAANVREALEKNGFGGVADTIDYEYERSDATRGKQLASTGGSSSILVPPTMSSEIIEFLRPATTFIQAQPRRVEMTNGAYYQAAGNTGASASYGRENSVPPYSEATFRDVNLSSKELQGKTAVSNLLIRRGVTAIRSFVDQDLRDVMAETMDRNMFLGTGLAMSPLGLYNVPGIATQAATNAQTPTAAQVDGDARWAINSLGTANVNLSSAKWVMSLETAGFLEDMRDGNGNFLYPTMQGANKTWKSLPVLVTTNLPTNLGAGNQSHISLIAYQHVLFGEEDGIELRVTSEGAYTDGSGNMRSAIERNETVMFAVARHDVGVRHLRALALLTAVRWGRA